MIHPNMCTMLSFVTTDAAIDKKLLQEALGEIVNDTYNMISVDGDTSTNDTVLVLANGMAGNPEITEKNEDYETFREALKYVNTCLAKKSRQTERALQPCLRFRWWERRRRSRLGSLPSLSSLPA